MQLSNRETKINNTEQNSGNNNLCREHKVGFELVTSTAHTQNNQWQKAESKAPEIGTKTQSVAVLRGLCLPFLFLHSVSSNTAYHSLKPCQKTTTTLSPKNSRIVPELNPSRWRSEVSSLSIIRFTGYCHRVPQWGHCNSAFNIIIPQTIVRLPQNSPKNYKLCKQFINHMVTHF